MSPLGCAMNEAMLRSSLSLCLAIFLAVGLTGCGDEQTPAAPGGGGTGAGFGPPPNTGGSGGTGTGGSGGSIGTGGTGGGAGSTGGGGMGGVGGAGAIGPLGACNNPDDLMALANLGDPSEARRASATCGTTECSGVVDETTCVSRATICVGNRIPGLSLECSTCYGELAWCAGACNISCASNPCEGCLTCGQGSYAQCLEDLSACAGPLPPECGET